MWWSRRAVLAGAAAALAACGFTPLDAPGAPGEGPRGRVAIVPMDSSDGFILTGRLEELLGRPGPLAEWDLAVTLEVVTEAMALTTGNDTDRFNLVGRADWRLSEIATGEVVAAGTVHNFTAYSATASTVATLSAERDALRRLDRSLADAIVADITLALAAP